MQCIYVAFNVYIWLVLHQLILCLHKIHESHKPARVVQRKSGFSQIKHTKKGWKFDDEQVASGLSFTYFKIFSHKMTLFCANMPKEKKPFRLSADFHMQFDYSLTVTISLFISQLVLNKTLKTDRTVSVFLRTINSSFTH